MKPDPTQRAVAAQLLAMGADAYELGIYHRATSRMLLRRWRPPKLLDALSWLKHMNAHGHDIFIRSLSPIGLLLLDDLTYGAILRLKRDRLPPCAVIQTSPGNHQVWLRLLRNPDQLPLPHRPLSLIAANLARTYAADPGSADWRHFGRLSGFTNRKPAHYRHPFFPFVLLREATGAVLPSGRRLMAQALASLQQPPPSMSFLSSHPHGLQGDPTQSPRDLYRSLANNILHRNHTQPWRHDPDWSRMDFMIAQEMAQAHLSPERIAQAIREGSPNLQSRKKGHLDDYLSRTIRKAIASLSPP